MPKNDNNRRAPRDFEGAPDYDRDWSRSGPDYDRVGHEGGFRPHSDAPSRRSGVDRTTPKPPLRPHERGFQRAFGFATTPDAYPYAGVASEHRRGRFYGRGPKGYRRSDERIREEISDRLMTHPDIDASEIEVVVSDGVVTLAGAVEDRHEKRLAEYIAEDAVGVEDVENRLTVRHRFWSLTGEHAREREVSTRAVRDANTTSKQAARASSARNSARRDAEAR